MSDLLQLLQEGAPVRCLSIRQPWAWLIAHSHKPVENRTWRTDYRGVVLIHAAKGETPGDWEAAADIFRRTGGRWYPMTYDKGGIVGIASLTDCVTRHHSPWFFGPYGFVMEQARPLKFIPLRGLQGLWTPDPATLAAVMAQLKGVA